MSIRKIVVMSAVCISPFAVFAQATTGDAGGGSAGDGDRPLTYTRLNFSDVDKNRDGIIDKKESSNAKFDSALFKKMDVNSDGQVSQSEFDAYQAMTEGNKIPKK